ncbi:unnamed protein product, partial [Prorocentrum cordatum]
QRLRRRRRRPQRLRHRQRQQRPRRRQRRQRQRRLRRRRSTASSPSRVGAGPRSRGGGAARTGGWRASPQAPLEPFDCKSNSRTNKKTDWSHQKAAYCCEHHKSGCGMITKQEEDGFPGEIEAKEAEKAAAQRKSQDVGVPRAAGRQEEGASEPPQSMAHLSTAQPEGGHILPYVMFCLVLLPAGGGGLLVQLPAEEQLLHPESAAAAGEGHDGGPQPGRLHAADAESVDPPGASEGSSATVTGGAARQA